MPWMPVVSWEKILLRFGLEGVDPQYFVRSQWESGQRTCLTFIVYRWVVAIFFSGVIVYTFVNHVLQLSWALYFIYLTHWGLMTEALHFVVAAVIATVAKVRAVEFADPPLVKEPSIPRSHKVSWVLGNITSTVAIGITIGYWSAVYNPATSHLDASNFLTHLVNTVFILVDLTIIARPWRIGHFFHPLVFVLSYLFFNLVYWACGGTDGHGNTYIYSILDWNYPVVSTVVTLSGVIVVLFLHSFLWSLYRLRLYLYTCKRKHTVGIDFRKGHSNLGLDLAERGG